jgi:hypothetical protein
MRYRAVYKAELRALDGFINARGRIGKCVARFSRCLGLEAERQCRKRFGSAPSNSLVERGCEIRVTRPKVTPSKEPPSPKLS